MADNWNDWMEQLGINPEWFPIYYGFDARPFQLNGAPSGAAGAQARLSRSLPNPPHILLGIRVSNIYTIPENADHDDIQDFAILKNHVDGEQTLAVNLAQQNVVAQQVIQKHITGGQDGFNWYPLPQTFPMAGANNIEIVLTRLTAYPLLAGAAVLPQAYCTLVCAVGRESIGGYGSTQPVQRIARP